MVINIGQLIIWLIVGALVGSLTAMLATGKRQGLGLAGYLLLALTGAIVGGILFQLLRIDLGLLNAITFTGRDLLAAFIGSLLILFLMRYLRR
jgi:uncharacterized membrane protein YeaQ/YmgE (transglycosylase-associated protein family)